MLVSYAVRLFQGFIAPAVLFHATVLCYVRLRRSVVLNVDIFGLAKLQKIVGNHRNLHKINFSL